MKSKFKRVAARLLGSVNHFINRWKWERKDGRYVGKHVVDLTGGARRMTAIEKLSAKMVTTLGTTVRCAAWARRKRSINESLRWLGRARRSTMSNGDFKDAYKHGVWTNTRELRLGECIHGNGMAVCTECRQKRENRRDLFAEIKEGFDKLKIEDHQDEGIPPVVLPNGAVMTPAGFAEQRGESFGGCPKCHRVGCPGAPRFKGICDDDELGPDTTSARECDRSDPERCVLQEHYHGLTRLLGTDDLSSLPGQLEKDDDQDDHCFAYTPDERELPSYTGYLDIDAFLDDCLETMRVKGHDYRQGNDADLLHNFRTVANTVGVDMMKVWFTYFYKHYSAMATFIKEGGQSESEPIEGRIKDQIVYLLLFYQMVQEKKAPVQHHPV